ncbi:formylglycine-generating enzyme family protein [Burkholderia territorii]|uniref:formylglycine-generating enzyme family protein n=1 Tax=Burkholderia territorii TaxID=1503055 RepID=UPI000AB0EDBE|nr:SUMF1/EgtB/PvdO family nonheme iron enzyme [Burkholderia territorii]
MKGYVSYLLCALCASVVLGAHESEGKEVYPPARPRIISPETESIDIARHLPLVSQSSTLKENLLELQQGSIQERIEKLRRKVLEDLVFVRGGTYMMGDFGSLMTKEKLPFTPWENNKPLHKVTLSSFSISRFKTTFSEFDVFLDANGQPHLDDDALPYRNALVPAGAVWKQARDYCQWLGEITGVPFDLPTEAQWEYAARSRGQNFLFSTNDGNLDFGRNIDDSNQRALITPLSDKRNKGGGRKIVENYPVGLFPPNPLGLYDMSSDGYEWVGDWYQSNYYEVSPEKNPRGPGSGKWKVARSASNDEPKGHFNNSVTRRAWDPDLSIDPVDGKPYTDLLTGKPRPLPRGGFSWRCVVNSEDPVNPVK